MARRGFTSCRIMEFGSGLARSQSVAVARIFSPCKSIVLSNNIPTSPRPLRSGPVVTGRGRRDDRGSGSLFAEAELAALLRDVVPTSAVPRFVEFVDSLSRTPTEKIEKTGLRSTGTTSNTYDAVTMIVGSR